MPVYAVVHRWAWSKDRRTLSADVAVTKTIAVDLTSSPAASYRIVQYEAQEFATK